MREGVSEIRGNVLGEVREHELRKSRGIEGPEERDSSRSK